MEIRKRGVFWDIDLEHTPVDWVYPGFTITTYYFRDGLVKKGIKHLVPGPYYQGDFVAEIMVTEESAPTRFNIGIGSHKKDLLKAFGEPIESGYKDKNKAIYYLARPEGERSLVVTFFLDGNSVVTKIVWERDAWH